MSSGVSCGCNMMTSLWGKKSQISHGGSFWKWLKLHSWGIFPNETILIASHDLTKFYRFVCSRSSNFGALGYESSSFFRFKGRSQVWKIVLGDRAESDIHTIWHAFPTFSESALEVFGQTVGNSQETKSHQALISRPRIIQINWGLMWNTCVVAWNDRLLLPKHRHWTCGHMVHAFIYNSRFHPSSRSQFPRSK